MKFINFIVWFYNYDESVINYDFENKVFSTTEKPMDGINSFYLAKTFQTVDKVFKEINKNKTEDEYNKILEDYLKNKCMDYADCLNEWRKALLKYRGIFNYNKKLIFYDYFDNSYILNDGKTFYRTHTNNITSFFNRIVSKDGKPIYKDFSNIYYKEYRWFVNCKNCGLIWLKEKGVYKNTVGYDFKMSYPSDMGSLDFQMPIKEGKEVFYGELPTNIKKLCYGIYRVKISCEDENFKMIFKLNEKHYYTSYSLGYAMTMKTRKMFDIEIELIKDNKPNAYIYNSKDLVFGKDVFGSWYNILKNMKKN